jgi:hypothetical protein
MTTTNNHLDTAKAKEGAGEFNNTLALVNLALELFRKSYLDNELTAVENAIKKNGRRLSRPDKYVASAVSGYYTILHCQHAEKKIPHTGVIMSNKHARSRSVPHFLRGEGLCDAE